MENELSGWKTDISGVMKKMYELGFSVTYLAQVSHIITNN